MSAETIIAPSAVMVFELVVTHLRRDRLLEPEKVPPNPQHSSGRLDVRNLMPFTLRKRSSGLEKNGLSISEALVVRSLRNVVHVLCNPILWGNSAHGNASTLTTTCLVQRIDDLHSQPLQ